MASAWRGLSIVCCLGSVHLLLAKSPELPLRPGVDFQVPPPSVQDFFQSGKQPEKFEPPVLPDSTSPKYPMAQFVGSLGEALSQLMEVKDHVFQSTLDNLEKLKKAQQYLELAEALENAKEWALAKLAYENAKELCPGSRFDVIATEQLQTLIVRKQLVEAAEVESSVPSIESKELIWPKMSDADRVQWLDQIFANYCKAVDEKKTKEIVILRGVIEQLSPETRQSLDRLKPREINSTVRFPKWCFVNYVRSVQGEETVTVAFNAPLPIAVFFKHRPGQPQPRSLGVGLSVYQE